MRTWHAGAACFDEMRKCWRVKGWEQEATMRSWACEGLRLYDVPGAGSGQVNACIRRVMVSIGDICVQCLQVDFDWPVHLGAS